MERGLDHDLEMNERVRRERELIEATGKKGPVTVRSLSADLRALGVRPGMVLLVHCSLRSLGWVCGGAAAVILALERAVRSYGTLVMPAHSGDLSEPEAWRNPPVPRGWMREIRASMPPFDPDLTPSRGMSVVAELFRTLPDVVRSRHPQVSFAAWGAEAIMVATDHSLEYGLGESSPLARIYELDGWVLLLGVDHSVNTSLHLAEYRASYPGKAEVTCGAPMLVGGHRRWRRFNDIDISSADFLRLGRDFTRRHSAVVRAGRVGLARAQLFPQRACVDFAVRWMERHRRLPPARARPAASPATGTPATGT
jgi:aminoglycoside 3-N-acetyltransferase